MLSERVRPCIFICYFLILRMYNSADQITLIKSPQKAVTRLATVHAQCMLQTQRIFCRWREYNYVQLLHFDKRFA